MAEKTNQPEITIILKKINDITRNQFFIDLMVLIQGINFLIHPQEAHKGIIQSLATAVFFVALSIIIGFIISHGFKKQNFRPIFLAFIFAALSVVLYFTAKFFAPAFHYFIAIAIISSGTINILSAYHLVKLSRAKKSLKLSASLQKDQTLEDVSGAIKNNIQIEAEKVLSPTVVFSTEASKFRYGQLFLNLILIFIGVMMVFFRFATNEILIRIAGGILVFSALSDLISLIWTHRESDFVKKLTHYRPSSQKQNHK